MHQKVSNALKIITCSRELATNMEAIGLMSMIRPALMETGISFTLIQEAFQKVVKSLKLVNGNAKNRLKTKI